MKEYTVTWTIQVDAKNHRHAAKQCLDIMRDIFSTATVFEVTGDDGEIRFIDLENKD